MWCNKAIYISLIGDENQAICISPGGVEESKTELEDMFDIQFIADHLSGVTAKRKEIQAKQPQFYTIFFLIKCVTGFILLIYSQRENKLLSVRKEKRRWCSGDAMK